MFDDFATQIQSDEFEDEYYSFDEINEEEQAMTDIHIITQILENNGCKVDITATKDKNIMLQVDSRFGDKVTMVFDGTGKGNFLYFQ